MNRTSLIYLVAGAFSLIFSFLISSHQAVVNPDAICYLLSAELIGQSGIREGMQICPQAMWPFYSFIISLFANVTHSSILTSAYILDAIFSLFSVTMFIAIVQQLGGSRRVMWLAAAVILLSHQFMSVRQYIIRDHGFWAFYLVSLFFMLRFLQRSTWLNALMWSGALILATLFRIEGAIFFILLPWIVFFLDQPLKYRVSAFLKLYSPVILVIVMLSGWLLMHPEQSLNQMGRLGEVGHRSWDAIAKSISRFNALRDELVNRVLPHEAARDAGLLLLLTMIMWYLMSAIQNISLMGSILIVFAWVNRVLTLNRPAKIALWGYLIINLLITTGFFAENLFLSKRYLIAQTLVLLLWVPFMLEKIQPKILLYAAMLMLFVPSMGVIWKLNDNKSHIKEAGVWIAANVPSSAALYSNDYQLLYYSQHYGFKVYPAWREFRHMNIMNDGAWKKYDYVALRLGHRRNNDLSVHFQDTGLVPVQEFKNRDGDRIVIVQVGGNKR